MATRMIKLKDIKEDDLIYPRNAYDWITAYKYSESMKMGANFPPICVNEIDKGRYILLDGKHRFEATKICKKEYIQAEILYIKDKKEMFVVAVQRNLRHGLKLSTDSLRKIVLKLEDFGYKKVEISDLIQMPIARITPFVANRLIQTTTGREIVSNQLQHIVGDSRYEGKINASKLEIIEDNFVTGSTQYQMLKDIITIIDSDMIDKKSPKTIALWKMLRTKLQKASL